ncbi:MAG: hypothetical protein KDI42_07410 [Gammaproteobacteria bacterium]|nr:hypothetical protein [Gammaproteobacteria bacterium]
MIPYSTLRRDREGTFVFRIKNAEKDGKAFSRAERVAIRTGLKFDARVEVLSGLEPGDRIVQRGFMGLTPGKTVEIANASPQNKPKADAGN